MHEEHRCLLWISILKNFMKVILKKQFASGKIKDDWNYLLQHFLITNLDSSVDYDRRRNAALAFLDRCKKTNREDIRDTLAKPVIFAIEDFEFIPARDKVEQYAFLLDFHNFGVALRDILNGYAPPSNSESSFQRMDSPPVEAYTYVGNSDLFTKIVTLERSPVLVSSRVI